MRKKWNIRAKVRRLFVRKKYKDELFRRIFNNKKALLELYNAINETEYVDEEELVVYTMEDIIYLGYKNDVSFIISGMLNLYEHQSTINPNMPLRGLIYFSKQYEAYIAQHKLNVYGERRVEVPFPQYIIFYNGAKSLENGEDKMILRLSDSFIKSDKSTTLASLECIATIYNINYGHNQNVMKRCRTLEEYSILISRIMENLALHISLEKAVDAAVVSCINDGILAEFLLKHRAEVVGMLFEEFDMKEYVKMERRDSFTDGREVGKAEGKAEALLEILEEKGQVPDSLRQRILTEQKIEVLTQWIKIAITATSFNEFEKKM